MNATFVVLRGAVELHEFTVPVLSRHVDVSESTVRTVLRRHPQYFEQVGTGSTTRRGGQPRLWAVSPQGRSELPVMVAEMAANFGDESDRPQVGASGELVGRTRVPVANPELATADDLHGFSTRVAARQLLADVVHRLLTTTPQLLQLSARTGDGIDYPGIDAVVEASPGSIWVPDGWSAWEIGAGGDPEGKAQSDYRKRTEEIPKPERDRTTFVTVSMGRFRGKVDWSARRRLEKNWRDVRALDADNLFTWLSSTPSVHVWASERMGLYPREVMTLDAWWESWSAQTVPLLSPAVLVAGRAQESAELINRLRHGSQRGEPSVITLYGPSRDEATAFVAASMAQWSGQFTPSEPADRALDVLVVSTPREWDRLAQLGGKAVLIPTFADADVVAATKAGCSVIIPMAPGDRRSRADIELSPIARDEASRAFQDAVPMEPERAYRYAGEARLSLSAFRRTHAINPVLKSPEWARGDLGGLLAALVLLGGWGVTNKADHEIVSKVAGRAYEDVERPLRELRESGDPPFVIAGDRWLLSAPQDAWNLLRPLITGEVLRRWHASSIEVLCEDDPLAGLSGQEAFLAPVRGIRRQFSNGLRQGVARAGALMGASEDNPGPDGRLWVQHATDLVGNVLTESTSSQSWWSVRDVLPLLAEAAPEEFLRRTELGVRGKTPALRELLVVDEEGSVIGPRSHHVELLWALEVLCWSQGYVVEACEILARLAEIDPAPKGSQRPMSSLRAVLLPWYPQTAASAAERVKLVDGLVRRHPVVGWSLLLNLLPQSFDSSGPTASPQFRDWKVSHSRDISEEIAVIDNLCSIALVHLETNPVDWAQYAETLVSLPPNVLDRSIRALEEVEVVALLPHERLVIWNALSTMVAKHRQFPDAPWSLPDTSLARLESTSKRIEPVDAPQRFARLFDWHPDIPGEGKHDPGGYDARVQEIRHEAIRTEGGGVGIGGLKPLIEAAPVPEFVGVAIAEVYGDTVKDETLAMFGAVDKSRLAAVGWLRRMTELKGLAWAIDLADELRESPRNARAMFYMSLPLVPATWLRLEQEAPEVISDYWTLVPVSHVAEQDVKGVVERFLLHRRPWSAISLLSFHISTNAEVLRPLVERALLDALEPDPGEALPSGAPEYTIGQLLDQLSIAGTSDEILAQLEWGYFGLLQHSRKPRALFARMRSDPDFFVELICAAFRASDETDGKTSEQEKLVGRRSQLVLMSWHEPPGLTEEGRLDAVEVRNWVERARRGLEVNRRVAIGDEFIGQVLSGSREGEDGVWPPEPIRDLLETIEGAEFGQGLAIGKFNSADVTTRGVFEGGRHEERLARQYEEWSRLTMPRWPATGRLLREMANHYGEVARRFSADAERWSAE